ncbi:MAG: aldolase/citrate lyase family protein [Tepidiformaceae bacterium]
MTFRAVLATSLDEAALEAALGSTADAILLAINNPSPRADDARRQALGALARIHDAGKAAAVTVNHPRTQLLRDDLDAIVAPALDAVFLPHASGPQDARDAAVLLREFEYGCGMEPGAVALFPIIDTARGLLRAPEIAVASPRTAGLVFDSAAYARDILARDEAQGPRLAYARGAVVAAARAAGGLPLVVASHLEARELAHYGFAGLVFSDPAGASAAAGALTPTAAVLEWAAAAIAAYDAARAEGAWVARLGTTFIDAHTARQARRLLE